MENARFWNREERLSSLVSVKVLQSLTAPCWSKIKHIDLSWHLDVTDAYISIICAWCSKIEKLVLAGCTRIEYWNFLFYGNISSLTYVDVSFIPSVHSTTLAMLAAFYPLK